MEQFKGSSLAQKAQDAWAILGPLAGMLGTLALGLIWAVQLEGKVQVSEKYSEETAKRVVVLEEKQTALDKAVASDIGRIRESLVRIETVLKVRN